MLNKHINLQGLTAVVTGASRGIGEAAALRLREAGANLVLLARSAGDIDRIASQLGDQAIAVKCDVADCSQVNAAINQAMDRFGAVDVLVNNAAVIDPISRLESVDGDDWSQAIDINLKGVFYTTQAVLPSMRAHGGVIINISSGAAYTALEGWSAYCASKAAVLSLTRSIHQELAAEGVRCVGLSPGTVATNMQRVIAKSQVNPVSQMSWDDHISPESVAEAITWLCTDDAKKYDGGDLILKTPETRAAIGLD